MTIYHLADNVTTTSLTVPVRVVEITDNPIYGLSVNQLFQFEVAGLGNCSATFQVVGSLDGKDRLPPQGVGGAWFNVGSPVTITGTTADVTPGIGTTTNATPVTHFGVIITALSGTNAAASCRMSG